MPHVSAEVRWFLDASQAARASEFAKWFTGGATPAGGGKKERQDVYLEDAKALELGVKRREGKQGLEVKALVADNAARVRLGGRIGTVQLWSKVTSHALTLPPSTCVTHKKRWLRQFDTAGDAVAQIALGAGTFGEEPMTGEPPDVGCNAEWTEVRVADTLQWTFGLEAFAFVEGVVDPRRVLVEALEKGLAALEESLPGRPPLDDPSWRELSYPAWLARK